MVQMDSGNVVPGHINSIFIAYQQYAISPKPMGTFITVSVYRPADMSTPDPYSEFPVWNARLYSNEYEQESIVLPLKAIQGHFSMMPFDTKHNVVVPLYTVRSNPSPYHTHLNIS